MALPNEEAVSGSLLSVSFDVVTDFLKLPAPTKAFNSESRSRVMGPAK